MKKLFLLIIVLSISALMAGAQTPSNTNAPAPSAEETELDQLNKEVVELYKLRKYDDALETAKKALPLNVKLHGEESMSVGVMYFSISALFTMQKCICPRRLKISGKHC